MEPPVQYYGKTNQYISQSTGGYEYRREQEAPIEPTSLGARAIEPGSVRAGHGQVLRDATGRGTLQNLQNGRLFVGVTWDEWPEFPRRRNRRQQFLNVIPRLRYITSRDEDL